MTRGRRKARRMRRTLPRIGSLAVASEQPNVMANADAPEDATHFAEQHGAEPLDFTPEQQCPDTEVHGGHRWQERSGRVPRWRRCDGVTEMSTAMVNAAGRGFLLTEPEPLYPRRLTTEELTGGKDDTQLTAELAAALRQIPACSHCGGRHTRACPRVKRLQFHPNGQLASVEFWAAGKWDDSNIIWQEHLAEADEADV